MTNRVVGLVGWTMLAMALAACTGPPTTPAPPPLTPNDRTKFIAACMKDAGWEVEAGWDQSVGGDYPTEQYEAITAAIESCNAKGLAQFPLPVFDDPAMRAAYAAEVAERQCLIDAGFDTPEPPALQTYLDNFTSARWEAIESVLRLHPELFKHDGKRYRELMTRCPPPRWQE